MFRVLNSPESVLVASGQTHVGVKDILFKSFANINSEGQFKSTPSAISLMCA